MLGQYVISTEVRTRDRLVSVLGGSRGFSMQYETAYRITYGNIYKVTFIV